MYRRSFLYEEAKIEQRTPLKEELCEIGEKAISRFTSFFCRNYNFLQNITIFYNSVGLYNKSENYSGVVISRRSYKIVKEITNFDAAYRTVDREAYFFVFCYKTFYEEV